MKKRVFAMVGALALVAAVGVGSTLAYFTDNDKATNVVTTGHVDIELLEKSNSNKATEVSNEGIKFEGVVPGDVINKVVTIEASKTSRPCYVRVKVTADSENEALKELLVVASNGVSGSANVNEMTDMLDLYHSSEDDLPYGWIYSGDGYWYLCEKLDDWNTNGHEGRSKVKLVALAPGASVDLFKNVKIDSNWSNAVADSTFDIKIFAEAIQAEHISPEVTFDENGGVFSWSEIKTEEYKSKQN